MLDRTRISGRKNKPLGPVHDRQLVSKSANKALEAQEKTRVAAGASNGSGSSRGLAVNVPCTSTSGQSSSPDTVSSSSESSSLSEVSPVMKQYETADTLQRRDSANGYHTAKGELSLINQKPGTTPKGLSMTHKPSNPAVITFNPKDIEKSRTYGDEKYKRVSDPHPQPQPNSPSTPTSQSVHSDVYSTVFALQSLGDDSWPAYLTKVRSMWDDQLHNQNTSKVINEGITGSGGKKGQQRSSQGQYDAMVNVVLSWFVLLIVPSYCD